MTIDNTGIIQRMTESLIEAMKNTAAELSEMDNERGELAWRKINALGKTPDAKTALEAARDIELLYRQAQEKQSDAES